MLKIGRVALIAVCGVFLASIVLLAPSGFFENDMGRATVPLFFILLGITLVERSLMHIASIKLYRSEREDPQPQGGATGTDPLSPNALRERQDGT